MSKLIKAIMKRFLATGAEEKKLSDIEIKVLSEWATTAYNMERYDDRLESAVNKIMEFKFEEVFISETEYDLSFKIGKDTYSFWNANYPYAWLNKMALNGKRVRDDRRTNKNTAVKFKIWVELGKEKMKSIKAEKEKINDGRWGLIYDNYHLLKNAQHYSHHTINSYMNEIVKLKDDCSDTLGEHEVAEILNPHLDSLLTITTKSRKEHEDFIKEQEEKEQAELQKAKENYKVALLESSELLKGRYSTYLEDFNIK